MGKPSAPEAPDPKETASAQTGTNVMTAIANSYMGNINQVTGDGTQKFTYEMKTIKDPVTGKSYDVPITTSTQTLSPQQQAIKDQNNATSLNLGKLATSQSSRLMDLLGSPMSLSGAPSGGDASGWNVQNYQQYGSGPQLQTSIRGGNVQDRIANSGDIQGAVQNAGGIQRDIAGSGDITKGIANSGGIRNQIAGAGNINSNIANAGDIRNQIAGAGNINSNIANAGGIQRDIATSGNITRGIANAGGIQSQLGNAGDITRSYGTDYSSNVKEVQDALMSRQQPYLDQDRKALETKLANQGIQLGSAAYDSAMGQYGQQANDARYGAILNAGQEQSRLAGLAQQQAMFQNSAQQQSYNQLLGSGQFANSAQAQQYMQNANDAQFANSAQAQQFGQNQTRMQASNAAQAQQYGQNANDAAFGNQAQAQKFGQNQAQLQAYNAAQQQRYGQNANDAAFGNQAQAQQFGQNQAQLQAYNAAQQQRYGQNANNAQFANSAQAQQFGQNQAQMQASNAAQAQQYGQNANNMQLGNAAQAQQFGQNQSQLEAYNAAQQQRYGQSANNAAFANQANQQMYQNQNTAVSGNNALQDQSFNAQQAIFSAQNAQRSQYLNEQYAQRNQPLNEIAGMLSGSQVTAPNFQPMQGQAMPNVDYAGIVQQNYANQMGAYNSQMQQSQSLMGGLFGLGSSYIMSDERTKTDIEKVGNLDGKNIYSYRYKSGGPMQMGVMAQEVEKTDPDAVREFDGIKHVNYGKLFQLGEVA